MPQKPLLREIFKETSYRKGVPSKRRTGESKMITKARKLDILYGAA